MTPDHYEEPVYSESEGRYFTAAHILRVLRGYLPAVMLAVAAVAVAYAIIATIIYLVAPSSRTIWQPFRLNFRGATEGKYPNGVNFSTADIVSTPVLLRVFNQNGLKRFVDFDVFSRSVFVLEYNSQYEALAAEYQARLADSKLTSVDRERISDEFQSKRASLLKNDYALHFIRSEETATVPDRVVRKVLGDILKVWANRAVGEQHVLLYKLTTLSPEVMAASAVEQNDLVASVLVLRSKLSRVIIAIEELRSMPSAELVRSQTGKLSVEEIRLRLEDIMRFRLEPIVPLLRSGNPPDMARTRQFVEAQLAFDQRDLSGLQSRVDAIRETLAAYSMSLPGARSEAIAETPSPNAAAGKEGQSQPQTIVPQISDNFVDKLVALANQSADVTYRQRLTDELLMATQALTPAKQAVAYDQEMLRVMSTGPIGTDADRRALRAQIEEARQEARELVGQLNEIHRAVSEGLNPPTELFTTMGVPITRVERAVNFGRLIGYGVLSLLLTFAISMLVAIAYDYIRQQNEEEERATAAAAHEALT